MVSLLPGSRALNMYYMQAVEATTSLQRAAAAKEAEVETERRIQEAKTAAQEEAHSRVTSLLSVLALPPAAEGTGALASLQSVLLSSAGEKSEKDEIVSVFLSGAGEWQGLPGKLPLFDRMKRMTLISI